MPFGAWLRGPLEPILMDTLSEKRLRERGLLDSLGPVLPSGMSFLPDDRVGLSHGY